MNPLLWDDGPPPVTRQGQSGYTRFKELRFAPIFAQSLRISTAAQVAAFPYYHVDLNAGAGYNEEVHVPGSPLNFMAAMARVQRYNFFAFFIDHDYAAIRSLAKQQAFAQWPDRVFIHLGDNSELLPIVRAFLDQQRDRPQYAMGSIVIDPNGYHKGVPWDALRTFCAECPRFDLILNLNTRSFRMERPHILARRENRWNDYRLMPVSAFAAWFNRPHWMITEECRVGGHSFVQLVGRTLQTQASSYLSLGYHDLASDVGQAIVAKLEHA